MLICVPHTSLSARKAKRWKNGVLASSRVRLYLGMMRHGVRLYLNMMRYKVILYSSKHDETLRHGVGLSLDMMSYRVILYSSKHYEKLRHGVGLDLNMMKHGGPCGGGNIIMFALSMFMSK